MARSPNGSPARSKVPGAVLGPAWTVSAREASAVTQAAGEKNHELPTQPEAAADSKGRITPALWMPAAPAIAWLAFSSAETDWDAKFYLGASIWYAAAPERVLEWLDEVIERGDLIDEFQPEDFRHLHRHVRDAAVQTESFRAAKADRTAAKASGRKPAPLTISDDHIRQAASSLKRKLEGEQPAAQRDYEAIWEGSEKLRRALARGDLTACGWPGRGPNFSDNNAKQPAREPIPRDVFMRPVTVTQDGVFAFARGDDSIGYDHEVLWSGVLFRVDELHALSEAAQNDRPSLQDIVPAPAHPPDRGGKNADHDWPPFHEECRRYLQELLDKPSAVDPQKTKRVLNAHMKRWVKRSMKSKPDEKTIRTEAAKIFWPAIRTRTQPDRT